MTLPEPGPDEVVIGVVITVPDPHADALASVRRLSGDVEAQTIPPHVTLHGPVIVPRSDLEEIDAHLADVAQQHGPFVVHLRGTGTFRPVSPVVFVALARGIASCEQLQLAVHRGPLDGPLRFPYHPHVTVAQEVGEDALDAAEERLGDFDGTFVVTAVDRYVHDADGQWRPVRSFPLTGRAIRAADGSGA